MARHAATLEHVELVVAAGGDGTVNEVINGLMEARALTPRLPTLGVLSIGRGNDFACGAGIPTELNGSVECLATRRLMQIDIGFLRGGDFSDGRFFGNGIGLGFDTVVGFEATKLTRIKGFAAYIVAAIKTLLFYYRAPELEIADEAGVVTRPCMQLSVMNGRRMGGAFFMAPKSRVTDGKLDVCVVGTPGRFAMLGLVLQFMLGTQAGSRHVRFARTGRISIRALSGSLPVHADGETIAVAGSGLDVEIVPGALTVISSAPEAQAEASIAEQLVDRSEEVGGFKRLKQ